MPALRSFAHASPMRSAAPFVLPHTRSGGAEAHREPAGHSILSTCRSLRRRGDGEGRARAPESSGNDARGEAELGHGGLHHGALVVRYLCAGTNRGDAEGVAPAFRGWWWRRQVERGNARRDARVRRARSVAASLRASVDGMRSPPPVSTCCHVSALSSGSRRQSLTSASSSACASDAATREPGHRRAPAEKGPRYRVWSSSDEDVPVRAAWDGRSGGL